MKIAISTLKRIIKEELGKVLTEAEYPEGGGPESEWALIPLSEEQAKYFAYIMKAGAGWDDEILEDRILKPKLKPNDAKKVGALQKKIDPQLWNRHFAPAERLIVIADPKSLQRFVGAYKITMDEFKHDGKRDELRAIGEVYDLVKEWAGVWFGSSRG